jgi:hypothetical protein
MIGIDDDRARSMEIYIYSRGDRMFDHDVSKYITTPMSVGDRS